MNRPQLAGEDLCAAVAPGTRVVALVGDEYHLACRIAGGDHVARLLNGADHRLLHLYVQAALQRIHNLPVVQRVWRRDDYRV